ncbi:MAG: nitroreductase family protein [Sedimentibacter saalensis]|uniref:nitroreductase family protein n=1 Tax=Sedimentibacter saalensis TaxID=130788 RepID=UPI002B1FF0F9|nr:nitroreductase family protein [Sedimentibacter saalensis]MEA5095593.1 nitroreductase family protein [Sedimentibacter saalensis]
MNYKDTIASIKSIRDYKKEEVSLQKLDQLKDYFDKGKRLFEDINIEVLLKNKNEVYDNLKNSAGYNDLMIEAPHYMIILSEEKDHYIENTGYAAEDIMLKAWELGIGSCWITFKDGEDLKKKLNIQSDKKVTALISLGFDDNKNKVIYETVYEHNPTKTEVKIIEDNVSDRLGIRDVVFMKKWGENADPDELTNMGLLEAFVSARRAPSTKNRQPWRFIVDDGTIVLALRSDSYADNYEEKIDTGVIMLYFEAIIDSTLFDMKWKLGKTEKNYEVPADYEIVGYCIS